MASTSRRVVIFDLGGVVAPSPIVEIQRFARDRGIPDLNHFLGRSSAWDAFMRGQILPAAFCTAVVEECGSNDGHGRFEAGVALGVDGWSEMLRAMTPAGNGGGGPMTTVGDFRPLMIRTLRRLRAAGFTVVALTNNFNTDPPKDASEAAEVEATHARFVALFDYFIESRVVGLSKPDPAIYRHALSVVGCEAGEAVFLDDIGANLKTARKMGIRTILVKNTSPTSFHGALEELESVTGMRLLDGDRQHDEGLAGEKPERRRSSSLAKL